MNEFEYDSKKRKHASISKLMLEMMVIWQTQLPITKQKMDISNYTIE